MTTPINCIQSLTEYANLPFKNYTIIGKNDNDSDNGYYGALIGYTPTTATTNSEGYSIYQNGQVYNSAIIPIYDGGYTVTNGVYLNSNTNSSSKYYAPNSAYIIITMKSNNPIYVYYCASGLNGGSTYASDEQYQTNSGSASGSSGGYLFLAKIIPNFPNFSTPQYITIFTYLYNNSSYASSTGVASPSGIQIGVGYYTAETPTTQNSPILNCPDGTYTINNYFGLSSNSGNNTTDQSYVEQQYIIPNNMNIIYEGNYENYSYSIENINTSPEYCIGGGVPTNIEGSLYGGSGYNLTISELNYNMNILQGGGSGALRGSNYGYSGGEYGGGTGGNTNCPGGNATSFGAGGGGAGNSNKGDTNNGGYGYPGFCLVYTKTSLYS